MSFKELVNEVIDKYSVEGKCFACPICKESVKSGKKHKRKNHSVWISKRLSILNKTHDWINDAIYYENTKKDYFFVFYKDKFIVNFKSNEFTFSYDDFEDLDPNKIFNKIKKNLPFM